MNDCTYTGNYEEPCWGEVHWVDECIQACAGHADIGAGKPGAEYKPQHAASKNTKNTGHSVIPKPPITPLGVMMND